MTWADKARTLRVRANADQPDQAAAAVAFGAEGIGLCRTEHMFFGEDKIGPMREMILAETIEARRAALAKLLPLQRDDFAGIFRAMAGRPVTIRTLDPPLHEFLPHDDGGAAGARRRPRHPAGTRPGARRGAARVQPDARLPRLPPRHHLSRDHRDAGARHLRGRGAGAAARACTVHPEVMIPLVGHVKELELQAAIVRRVAAEVAKASGVKLAYTVGTMIEVPRGALTADQIAATAEFFSFGTNDLTQTTLGVSRDDAGRFLVAVRRRFEIYARDPFQTIDEEGVGALIRIAVERGRATRPKPEDRHLRRARRRPAVGRVLPPRRARLRLLLAVPRADRPPGRGAGRAGGTG